MLQKEHVANMTSLFNDCLETAKSKGDAYSDSGTGGDCLANFKKFAEDAGVTKYQTWLIFFNKHVSAISNAIKINPENPVDKSEGLSGRIMDGIVYLTLLYSMLYEQDTSDANKE